MKMPFLFQVIKTYCKNGSRLALENKTLLFIDMFLATTLAFFMQYFIWKYLYSQGTDGIQSALELKSSYTIRGFGLFTTMLYYGYVIVLNRLNNGYGIIEEISNLICSGRIELSLIKPVAFPLQKFSEFLGGSLVYLPSTFIPIFLDFLLQENSDLLQFLIFIPSLFLLIFLSQVLCFLIAFLISLLTFKSEQSDVVLAIYGSLGAFFGGVLLPPSFWPEKLKIVMNYNPFAYTMAALSHFSATKNYGAFVTCLFGNLVYIIILTILCTICWNKVIKTHKGIGG